jgi:hypothetical protein
MNSEKNAPKLPCTLEEFGELLGIDPVALLDRLNRGRLEFSHSRVMAARNGFARRRLPARPIQASKI